MILVMLSSDSSGNRCVYLNVFILSAGGACSAYCHSAACPSNFKGCSTPSVSVQQYYLPASVYSGNIGFRDWVGAGLNAGRCCSGNAVHFLKSQVCPL